MRIVVEPRHEDDTVDAHSPLLLQHLLGFRPEDSRRGALLAFSFPLDELFAFWEGNPNETNSNAQASSDPEDGFKGLGLATNS